ncbi:MAG: TIGR00159 family protein [Candidatus Omnitrophica bacterium]|nr:TIGR00159 family protein [Candidatus Omnitrophota bacterium]
MTSDTLKNIWYGLKPVLEIGILWFVYYRILVFFQGTRAFQVLKGIIFLVVAFFAFQIFGLDTLDWLLTKIFAISVIAFLIIFQPELRQGLAKIGQHHLFSLFLKEEEIIALIDEIASAAETLSKKKIGAIIAIERANGLKTYAESGIILDCKVSAEIIQTIFEPGSLLHDGGIIIQGDRVASAVCLFPLTENPNIAKTIGTRHRAAVGLTEQTDAIVVVVSEESGSISFALNGKLHSVDEKVNLIKLLKNNLIIQQQKGKK